MVRAIDCRSIGPEFDSRTLLFAFLCLFGHTQKPPLQHLLLHVRVAPPGRLSCRV